MIPPIHAGEFDDILNNSIPKDLSDPSEEINLVYYDIESSALLEPNGSIAMDRGEKLLGIENLTLLTPKSRTALIWDLSLEISEKDHLLVSNFVQIFYPVLVNLSMNRSFSCV